MSSEELNHILPNTIVGPYRIVRGFKGRGGMARIFEAEVREKYRQPNLPRRLALKIAKEAHQAALVAEAGFISRFDHPNVVRIFPLPLGDDRRPVYAARERFPFGWGWYYAMELLSGSSLERLLTRPTTTGLLSSPSGEGRQLSLLKSLGIARQMTAALEHIHEHFVINLDIKPGNVLFRRQRLRYLRGSVPQAVLCDFGISRDLRYPRAGILGVATPEYISPEQTTELGRNQQLLDARSDIFPGRHPLRDAHWHHSLCQHRPGSRPRLHPHPAKPIAPLHPSTTGRDHNAGAGQRPDLPLPDRARNAERPRTNTDASRLEGWRAAHPDRGHSQPHTGRLRRRRRMGGQ